MWLVTYDHFEQRPRLLGVFADMNELTHAFRLYDDDQNLIYSGFSSDRDSQAAFDPLDYFSNREGCTEIHYRQDDGSWKLL
ncbi:MAG: hypothetical protein ACK443_05795 [Methylococcaceae bacterium]|jgi:hypothetical protein